MKTNIKLQYITACHCRCAAKQQQSDPWT